MTVYNYCSLIWYDPFNSPKILLVSIRELVLESMHLEIDTWISR